MTGLERELQATVKLQEEIFRGELQTVTEIYRSNLNNIVQKSNDIMMGLKRVVERQNDTIEKQSKALGKYENELSKLEISLNQEPLWLLERQLRNLDDRLDDLERTDKDLLGRLNNLLRKL